MARTLRSLRSVVTVLIVTMLASSVGATASPEVPTTGASILGAGFSGKPFVLGGDLVIETNGLYESIRDYEDAANPEWIAWHEHALDGIWHTILHDQGLLVGLRDEIQSGFDLVDVSDPSAPTTLASVAANYFPSAWLSDGVLMLAAENYLVVYDLSDPEAPAFSHFLPLGELYRARWFSPQGAVLYLLDSATSLRVLDLADPLHPADRSCPGPPDRGRRRRVACPTPPIRRPPGGSWRATASCCWRPTTSARSAPTTSPIPPGRPPATSCPCWPGTWPSARTRSSP
jgi:hypothetical protein